jgi:hypothetical protein
MAAETAKSTLLIESQYFPNISYYKTLINFDILLIERYEHYQKVSFRNRCYIAGPNGSILLSVPLVRGKNQRTLMKDVKISNEERWQGQHWKTLVSAYRRSPWFEYHEESLGDLYRKEFIYLLDWNTACFEWANQVIGLSQTTHFTDQFEKSYAPETGVTDLRDRMTPSEPALSDDSVEYTQVFQERTGFLQNLSILDLIFCEGRRSLELLK